MFVERGDGGGGSSNEGGACTFEGGGGGVRRRRSYPAVLKRRRILIERRARNRMRTKVANMACQLRVASSMIISCLHDFSSRATFLSRCGQTQPEVDCIGWGVHFKGECNIKYLFRIEILSGSGGIIIPFEQVRELAPNLFLIVNSLPAAQHPGEGGGG